MHTPGSLTQPLSNDGSWNDEAPVATVTPVVNGRRSAGQSSCPGDTAPGSDIFDVSRDILSGASFKSNSVNIFSIKDDPFDDEFFKST